MARRVERIWWLAPLAAALAAAATLMLDRETGFPALLELQGRIAEGTERVVELQQTRDRLLTEIEGLRSDPFAIEASARARLGMVRPGERVLRFAAEGSD